MASELGSFVVSIKAQIEGYQSQIAKIKQELAKVGKDTDIGKEISKSLKTAETQVARLGKTMEKRISSESQILALKDSLQGIDRMFMDIGDAISRVTWDDLNTDKLKSDLTAAQDQVSKLTNDIATNFSNGMKEAIKSSDDLKKVFDELKIDPDKMTAGDIGRKLSEHLQEASAAADSAQEALSKAQEKAQQAANAVGNLNQKLFEVQSAGDSIQGIFKELQTVTTTSINADNLVAFKERATAALDGLSESVKTAKADVISNLQLMVSQLNSDLSIDELQQKIGQINAVFNSLKQGSLSSNTGFTNINKLQEFLSVKDTKYSADELLDLATQLEEVFKKFNNLGLNDAARDSLIDRLLNSDGAVASVDAVKQTVISAIQNYIKSIKDEKAQADKELRSAIGAEETARTKATETSQAKAMAEAASSKFIAEIATLKAQNQKLAGQVQSLEKEIRQLKTQIDARAQGNKNPLAGAGGKINRDSEQSFLDTEKAASLYVAQLEQVKAKEQLVGNIQTFVQRWFSVYAAARLVSKAFNTMKNDLKDLDEIMTKIAIVTDKTQGDLWKQMPDYAGMAKQYATSIKGVYQVSQLYYQQGLEQKDVMALTEQTLKMAKISGLEYATATDYMTNAVRSFKMEMEDSQKVVDVYSELAANAATSTAELATAMSKTASSAESVGSSFESTSAMMAVMIESTRESAENIGSAMKSIISRYGEMKTNPAKLVDSEGEAMSLNKVDTALQSVGISIKDAKGEFRNFDDVIMELSKSWDSIDKNTQRYIATIMAGNRQQSRFLALVSNGERLAELTEKAANAEDTAQLQVLKTMDSISAKAQQLQTSLQGLYTEGGFENLYKGLLDGLTKIVDTFNRMPKLFGNIPVTAIATFTQLFINIGGLITTAVAAWKNKWTATRTALENNIRDGTANGVQSASLHANELVRLFENAASRIKNVLSNAIAQGTSPSSNANPASNLIGTNARYQPIALTKEMSAQQAATATAYNNTFLTEQRAEVREKNYQEAIKQGLINEKTQQQQLGFWQQYGGTVSTAARAAGASLQILSATMDKTTRNGEKAAGAVNLLGGTLSTIGYAISQNYVMAAIIAVTTIINALDTFIETSEEKIKRLKQAAETANNDYLQKKADYKDLDEQIKKIEELKKARFDGAEANQKYLEASNALAEIAPELISYIDNEGNAVLDLSKSYEVLAESRRQAIESGKEAGQSSVDLALAQEEEARNNYNKVVNKLADQITNIDFNNAMPFSRRDVINNAKGITDSDKAFYQNFFKDFFESNEGVGVLNGTSDIGSAVDNYLTRVRTNKNISFEQQDQIIELMSNMGAQGLSALEQSLSLDDIDLSNFEVEKEEINQQAVKRVKDWVNTTANGFLDVTLPQLLGNSNSGINWDELNQVTQESILNYLDENNKATANVIRNSYNIKSPIEKEEIEIPDEYAQMYNTLQEIIQDVTEVENAENDVDKVEKSEQLISNIIENEEIIQQLLNDKNNKFWNFLQNTLGMSEENINQIKNNLTTYLDFASQEGLPARQKRLAAELNTRNTELQNLQQSIWLESDALINSNKKEDIPKQEMLKNLPNANDLIAQYITSMYDSFDGAKGDYAKEDFTADYQTITKDLAELYSKLSKDGRQQFSQLIENKGKYTQDELNRKIADLIGSQKLDASITTALTQYYEKALNQDQVNQLLEERANKINIDGLKNVNQLLTGQDILGADEWNKFVDVYDKLSSLQKNGSITASAASDGLDTYAEILGILSNTSIIPAEQQDKIQKIFEDWDDFSLVGLNELQNTLKESGLNQGAIDQLLILAKKFANFIPENVLVDFETVTQKMVESSSDFSKALNKAAKGMDIKEATEMADKLNISIEEFDFKAGQYLFTNAKQIQDAYSKYNEDLLTDLNAAYDKELIKLRTDRADAEIVGDFTKAKSIDAQIEELTNKKDALEAAINEWGAYQVNSALLQAGQIDLFLENLGIDDTTKRAELTSLIQSADIEKIAADSTLAPFIDVISSTYGNIVSDLTSKLAKSVKSGAIAVQQTKTNEAFLNDLIDRGLATLSDDGKEVIIKVLQGNFDDSVAFLNQYKSDLTDQEYIETYQTLLDAFNQDITGKFTNLLKSDSISIIDAMSYASATGKVTDISDTEKLQEVMSNLGYTWNEVTQSFVHTVDDYTGLKEELEAVLADDNQDQKAINEARAQLAKLENEPQQNLSAAIDNITKNSEAISEDVIKNLANSLEGSIGDFDALINGGYFILNDNGTYTANLSALSQLISSTHQEFSDEFISSLVDSISKTISSARKMVTEGTTSETEKNTFAEEYKKLTGQTADFTWDKSKKSWTLSVEAYYNYQQALLDEAKAAQASDAEFAAILAASVAEIASAVNVSDFLKDISNVKVGNDLKTQLINYYKYKAKLATKDAPDGYKKIALEAAEKEADDTFTALSEGGKEAVEAYRQIIQDKENRDLTSEEVSEAYNVQLNQYKNAFTELNEGIQVGTLVKSEKLKEILSNTEGFTIEDGVVISVGNLVDVFRAIYNGMAETGEQTGADLDEVNTKIMTEMQKKSATLIDTIKNGMNISFEEFSNQLGNFDTGLNLDVVKKDMDAGIETGLKIASTGVMIEDLNKYLSYIAEKMGKSVEDLKAENPEEYISAVNEYNDALIEYHEKVSNSVKDQFNKLATTDIGKQVNLTYIADQYKKTLNLQEGEEIDYSPLAEAFGFTTDAFKEGIGEVTQNTKTQVLKIMRSAANGTDLGVDFTSLGLTLDEIIAAYQDILKSAMQEINSTSTGSIISSDTATLLVAYNSAWANKLESDGIIVLDSAQAYIDAAADTYAIVKESFEHNKTDLQSLNNSYANLIKANTFNKSTADTMLSSVSNLNTDIFSNFATAAHMQLEEILTEEGNVTEDWLDSIERTGTNSYRVSNWDNYIAKIENKLGVSLDKKSDDFINAYISQLQNAADNDTSERARTELMTSLVPNMEKLTYAQIGQIAKTFEMTVDEVLALVENNGDNTFNGAALIHSLNFDRSNKEFSKAILNQKQTLASNLINQMTTYIEAGSDGELTSYDTQALNEGIDDYIKGMRALGISVEIDTKKMRDILSSGGENAVQLAQRIAAESGQQLSTQDIETLYRSQISSYVNAIDTIVAKPGEIVDRTTANLIRDNGGKVNQLGTTGQFVVESAANLYEAYNDLLLKMKATGEATLADINKVAALALENRGGEQQVIDALGDAAGMTFTRFGEILADAGIELTEQMVNDLQSVGIIDLMGGNKMKIIDFQAFANLMHWDANSEEYVSAFKSYNDSLIEMNRQAERNILEEAQNVASAKGGDWVNITQLVAKINDGLSVYGTENAGLYKLNLELQKYGANIEDGLLKIDDSANIPAIIQTIAQAAAESGGLISSELAELADAVADAIKGYADLISGGIEGSLTNVQAEQLQDWANQFKIDIDFTETENGLKVSTQQAIKLQQELSKIDSMQGKLVFKDLVDAMSADKGNKFENISKTTAEIAKAQREIAANNLKIEDIERKYPEQIAQKKIAAIQEQNNKLQEQINLYRQIQQEQSIDPNQYNFMDRDLPEILQGPENYWNSVGKAFEAMNESGKTGKMAISDFYNIVSEMENLANISGQAFELAGYQIGGEASQAAQLITDGLGKLTNVDGKGVQVDLSQLGVNFVAGADNAKQNFADGVNELADAQIAMLDAAIQVLEIVVAMEQFKDLGVDSNENNQIDLSEIFGGIKFDPEKGFDKKYSEAADALLKQADSNDDLKKALEKVKVNGHSMYEMLDAARGTVEDQAKKWKALNMTEQQYQSVINAFYQAMLNGDYNLDTIQSSVWEILDQVMPDGTVIDLGERALVIAGGTHTQINWEDANTKEALKMFDGDIKKQKEEVTASVQRYQMGKGNSIDALITLAVNGKIKIETTGKGKNKKTTIIGPNGEKIDPKSEEGQKIIAKAALENAGVKDGKVVKSDSGEISAEGIIHVGDKIIHVTSDGEGNVKYHSDVLGLDFDSLDELLHAEYGKYTENELQHGSPSNIMSFDAWLHSTYNVTVITGATFKNKNGEVVDPSQDPELQKSLREFFNQNHEAVQNYLNDESNWEKDGDLYTLKLPDGSSITVEAPDYSSAAGQIEDQVLTALDPVAASVKTGIEKAFTDDKSSAAISEAISTGIKKALGQTNEIPISEGEQTNPPEITGLKFKAKDPTITEVTGTPTFDASADANASTEPPAIDGVKLKANNPIIAGITGTPTMEEASAAANITPPSVTGIKLTADSPSIEGITGTPTFDGDAGTIAPAKISAIRAVVSKLNIMKVTSAAFGKLGSLLKSMFGGADLTIPSATAKVTNLTVIGADNINTEEFKTLGEQIAAAIQVGLTEHPVTPVVNPPSGDTGSKDTIKPTSSSKSSGSQSSGSQKIGGAATQVAAQQKTTVEVDTSAAESKVQGVVDEVGKIDAAPITAIKTAEEGIGSDNVAAIGTAQEGIGSEKVQAIASAAESINPTRAEVFANATNNVTSSEAVKFKSATQGVSSTGAVNAKKAINDIKAPGSLKSSFSISVSKAKGNMPGVAQAKGTNRALVGGTTKTLMGELGPELVVSNGRYFVVGQNGAEFVDLANDAIVFNHLQTKKLLQQGAIGSRAKPFISETAAVAFARGNIPLLGPARKVTEGTQGADADKEPKTTKKTMTGTFKPTLRTIDWKKGTSSSGSGSKNVNLGQVETAAAKGSGPAMASAAEALAALKQLRAMWESLRNASLKDMGGMPGGKGGGGGGGGGGGNDKTKDAVKGINAEIERWYNWLQLIEETQNKINILAKEYTLLDKKRAASAKKLLKLQTEYLNRQQNKDTREQLVNEQTSYRTSLAKTANNGLFSAFYTVDENTGNIRIANDSAFMKYVKDQKMNQTIAGTTVGKNTKKIKKGTFTKGKASLKSAYTHAYQEKISYEDYKQLSAEERKYYTGSKKKGYTRKDYEKTNYGAKHKKFKTTQTIRSGLQFMDELQAKDKYGNLVHDAAEQLALIKAFGLYDEKMMAGVDKEQEGWEATVVQNFYDKIDADKAELEALNKSIQEQTEAALDDAAAMEEINAQIREMYTVSMAQTKELEKWHNLLQKIEGTQANINKLAKDISVLEADQIANGDKIYFYTQQRIDALKIEKGLKEDLAAAEEKEYEAARDLALALNDQVTPTLITKDKETGRLLFSDEEVFSKGTVISGSYKRVKKNKKGYEVDEYGNYRDDKGVLYNQQDKEIDENLTSQTFKTGNKTATVTYGKDGYFKIDDVIYDKTGTRQNNYKGDAFDDAKAETVKLDKNGNFVDNNGQIRRAITKGGQQGQIVGNGAGQLALETVKFNLKELDELSFAQLLEKLNEKDAFGNPTYSVKEKYAVWEKAGLTRQFQYDENGNKLYENFGELTEDEQLAYLNAGVERIQKLVDDANDALSSSQQHAEEAVDIEKELYDIAQEMVDKTIDLNNQLKEAVIAERQADIDAKNELKDALDKAANKTVEGLRESLEQERKQAESDKDEKELSTLQAQLAVLQNSGGSLSKIRDLQDKIQEKQQEMYFTERENSIDELDNAAQKQIEALELQTDILQTSLDYQVKQGLIWAAVNDKLATMGPEQLASYIMSQSEEYRGASLAEQQKTANSTTELAQYVQEEGMITRRKTELKDYVNKQIQAEGISSAQRTEILGKGQDEYDKTTGTSAEKEAAAKKVIDQEIKDLKKFRNDLSSYLQSKDTYGLSNDERNPILAGAQNAYDTATGDAKTKQQAAQKYIDTELDKKYNSKAYSGMSTYLSEQNKNLTNDQKTTILSGAQDVISKTKGTVDQKRAAAIKYIDEQLKTLKPSGGSSGSGSGSGSGSSSGSGSGSSSGSGSGSGSSSGSGSGSGSSTKNYVKFATPDYFSSTAMAAGQQAYTKAINSGKTKTQAAKEKQQEYDKQKQLEDEARIKAQNYTQTLKKSNKSYSDTGGQSRGESAYMQAILSGKSTTEAAMAYKNAYNYATGAKYTADEYAKKMVDEQLNIKSGVNRVPKEKYQEVYNAFKTEYLKKNNLEKAIAAAQTKITEIRKNAATSDFGKVKDEKYDKTKNNSRGIKQVYDKLQKIDSTYGGKALKAYYIQQYTNGKNEASIAKTLFGYTEKQLKEKILYPWMLDKNKVTITAKDAKLYELDSKTNQIKAKQGAATYSSGRGIIASQVSKGSKTGTMDKFTYRKQDKKYYYKIGNQIFEESELKLPSGYTWAQIRAKLKTFAQGGKIDFTGPAWVDGTKSNPEFIFNAEQMEILRSGLTNNVNLTNSLNAALVSALDNLPNANTYNSINNTNDSVVIEHAAVNVSVQEVSNDYDARRMGEQALNEMVRIARKTGARNISRR